MEVHRSVGSLVQSRQVEGWVCQLELLLSGRHHRMAGAGGLVSQWRIARKGSGRMAPLFYSNVEVVLHRSADHATRFRGASWAEKTELID